MPFSQLTTIFYKLTKTNATSMSGTNLNDFMQPALSHVISLIMQSDGRWQYDDANYTDTPIATTNLVSGQQDYSLSTSHLRILGVSALGNTNIWRKLLPFDPNDLADQFGPLMDRAQFFVNPGLPLYYDLNGGSIYLYPAPDNGITVTLAAGLKVYYQRGPLQFDYNLGTFTDGTGTTASVPGFNSLYHDLVPLWGAYNYCLINLPSLTPGYLSAIQRKEAALILDYSKRDKDERQVLTMAPIAHR